MPSMSYWCSQQAIEYGNSTIGKQRYYNPNISLKDMTKQIGDSYMTIIFRNYKSEDYSEITDMIFALYQEDPEGKPINHKKVEKTINELFEHPEKGKIIVIEHNAQIVGYAIIIFYWSNEYGGDILNIDELYIKPALRKQGIATQFLNQIFKIYREEVSAFGLEVTPSNKRVLSYYKKLGFKATDNLHMIYQLS